jgi:hypothetical protein
VLVVGNERRFNSKVSEQSSTVPCVFRRNQLHIVQRLDCPR